MYSYVLRDYSEIYLNTYFEPLMTILKSFLIKFPTLLLSINDMSFFLFVQRPELNSFSALLLFFLNISEIFAIISVLMISILIKICLIEAKTLGSDDIKDNSRIQSTPTDFINILENLHYNDMVDKTSLRKLIKNGNSKNIGLKTMVHVINMKGVISSFFSMLKKF